MAYKFFKTTQEQLEKRKQEEKNGAAAGRVVDLDLSVHRIQTGSGSPEGKKTVSGFDPTEKHDLCRPVKIKADFLNMYC